MSRTLSATIAAELAKPVQRTCHLLTFVVGAMTYRFTDGLGSGDVITHAGNSFLPHMTVESGPRHSESLRLQPVTVKLQNIDLATARTLKLEGSGAQGQEAILERLFLAARETVLLFRGRISEIDIDEQDAAIQLAGDLDPTAATIPRRKYSALNSTDGKTFGEYSATPHLFDGFIHLTRDLTVAVEGQAVTPDEGRTLGDALGDYP